MGKFFKQKNNEEEKSLLDDAISENFNSIINNPEELTNDLVKLFGSLFIKHQKKNHHCFTLAFYNPEQRMALEFLNFKENNAHQRWLRLCDFVPYLLPKSKLAQQLITLFEKAFGNEFAIHFGKDTAKLSARKLAQQLSCVVKDYYSKTSIYRKMV